jgi:hypothetical protein
MTTQHNYLAAILSAHADATGDWTDLSWDDDTGLDANEVAADAAEAEDHALEALGHARAGRWADAAQAAGAACALEDKYGDCPTWRPFRDACEAALEAGVRSYTLPDWLEMHTPPEEQGQTVTSSYGVDLQSGLAVRCTTDRSDGSEAWAVCDLSDEEQTALEFWCAANSAPSTSGEWVAVERSHA